MVIHDCLELDKHWDALVDVEMILLEMKMIELKAELENLNEEDMIEKLKDIKDENERITMKSNYIKKQRINEKLKNITKGKAYAKLFMKHGNLADEVKLSKINLSGSPEILASNYCFIMFRSFKLANRFTMLIQDKVRLAKLGYKYAINCEAEYAPDPFDIDWNEYARPYKWTRHLKWYLMAIFCFLVLPSFTFMMEYGVPLKLASWIFSADTDAKAANMLVEYKSIFLFIRLIISSIYSAVVSFFINWWFKGRRYKTLLERERSNFTFFNIYFLINMIVADFYGIVIVGIKGIGTDKKDETLQKYHRYLFSSALKVSFSLMFSPYLLKLLDYAPRIWAYFRIYCYDKYNIGRPTTIMDKIKRDMPVNHSIHEMGSFLCQCLFFITFFIPFMIPLLNILLLLSLLVFKLQERYFVLNYHSLQRSIHFTSILSIYKVSLFGFLLLQILNFSNSNFVLKFLNLFSVSTEGSKFEPGILNFFKIIGTKLWEGIKKIGQFSEIGKNIWGTILDLGFISLFGVISIWILACMFGKKNFTRRIVTKLVELEEKISKREVKIKESIPFRVSKTLDSIMRKMSKTNNQVGVGDEIEL